MAERTGTRKAVGREVLIAQLNDLSIRLMSEQTADGLMDLMLEECMKITSSDGASIYLKNADEQGAWITFKHTKNYSNMFPFNEFALPINNQSFAGYCVMTGEVLNIPDLSKSGELYGIQHNDHFDRIRGYRTVNMLVVPMKNVRGQVLGVLQLLNKKKDYAKILDDSPKTLKLTTPYTKEEERLISSLASQLAVQLERLLALESAEAMFKSLAEVVAEAVDERCETRKNHSARVARCSLALAEALNGADEGPYKDTYIFEEDMKILYYAAILHDIGKVSLPDEIACLMEGEQIGLHVEAADRILEGIRWPDDLKGVPALVACHHEQYDGKGYPKQLQWGDIPLMGKILAVANLFINLSEDPLLIDATDRLWEATEKLNQLAAEGYVDPAMTRVLIESECYRQLDYRILDRLTN